ncbi:MAG: efflux RND transporter periplasmic adaptor subunit [Candidatus Brocadiaceae bacterium]|nr:efflux RND transporter periplasmic adaptor subunit [Candidatus Brocadiaceae bacterium]
MPAHMRIIMLFIFCICFSVFTGCKKQKDIHTGPNPRPVTVIELREMNPVKELQLTGSVKSWKEQDIAFEVNGRLEKIVEMGIQLEGRWEEEGEALVQGDILARIDARPYRIRVKAAAAERDRAEAEYVRYKKAWEKNAVAEVDFIRATADRDSKQARFEQAEYDLEKCVLHAPFTGEISEVYVEAGGYVQTGQPVAHLVMMDPIKVDVSVSSKTAANLKLRDTVRLFLPDEEKPVYGIVYEKATVADPETRTFRISVLTRNTQYIADRPPGDPLLDFPRIARYTFLQRMKEGDTESPFFVEENRSLRREGDSYYVWAAPDYQLGDTINSENPLVTLRKYAVTPGEHRMNLQGLYLVRALTDIGNLTPGTFIAMDVPNNFKDGDQVLVASKQWRLRPGQLLPIALGKSVPTPGLYLPMSSIIPVDETTGVLFIADNGRARKVTVKILDNVGELFRVEAVDQRDDHLVAAGSRVITDYIHFLQDEEPVKVIKRLEIHP